MRCQKCPKPAMVHITEVHSEERFEELHFCEDCAQNFLNKVHAGKREIEAGSSRPESLEVEPIETSGTKEKSPVCPNCKISFANYRSTGRLGCPNDYQEFREDLVALLENVHGETRHCGKVPKNLLRHREKSNQLEKLKRALDLAVAEEKYEEAARLRDRIKDLGNEG